MCDTITCSKYFIYLLTSQPHDLGTVIILHLYVKNSPQKGAAIDQDHRIILPEI